MLYLVAILMPPAAVIYCSFARGKGMGQIFANILLTFIYWIPGALHALAIVYGHKQRVRTFYREMENGLKDAHAEAKRLGYDPRWRKR